MRCPKCHEQNNRVIDSRDTDNNLSRKRRRKCDVCGERFSTLEKIDYGNSLPKIIKNDKRREFFSVDKLRKSITLALAKSPISTPDIDALIDNITRRIISGKKSEISSATIGSLVMQELHGIDIPAYIRFASVYHRFKDLGAFSTAIDDVQGMEKVTRQISFGFDDALIESEE